MINIYISNVITNNSEKYREEIKKKFSHSIIQRIENAHSCSYKLRRITSRLMLIKIFEELKIDERILNTVYYTKKGKLKMLNLNYNISISYSSNLAICLISTCNIGLDVEDISKEVKTNTISLLEKLTNIRISSVIDFYILWTKMESIIKIYDTKGLCKIFQKKFLKSNFKTEYLLLDNSFLIALSSQEQIGEIKTLKFINIL